MKVIYKLPNGKQKTREIRLELLKEFLDQLESNKCKIVKIEGSK